MHTTGAPYAICQQLDNGDIDRERARDVLSTWNYAPGSSPSETTPTGTLFPSPGTINDLSRALDDGLIDINFYQEVIDMIHGQDDIGYSPQVFAPKKSEIEVFAFDIGEDLQPHKTIREIPEDTVKQWETAIEECGRSIASWSQGEFQKGMRGRTEGSRDPRQWFVIVSNKEGSSLIVTPGKALIRSRQGDYEVMTVEELNETHDHIR